VTTLLVANRGEIARRIFRTARRMGMRTIAVYSDADAQLPFVREADTAVRIGPAPARDSYLAIDRILTAARETEAELIHPGYGFLAESAQFAHAVAAAGLRFVGPPADVLKMLGDKAAAKAMAARAGVPVLPGYRGDDQSDDAFMTAARSTGYPVMLKPVAGGGGIGMQRVREERGLREALARARRIASAAFGDERLLLERLVERPRHVEVQIVADERGAVASYGERDCSAQRRNQKIVEETPAPSLPDDRRDAIAKAAVTLAREAGYRSAGTVEFVLDGKDFFFLEVNARLQVEHPVTELVWQVDLVEEQLRIAQGGALSHPGARPMGHAIEARLYAEDPAAGFVPSAGRIAYMRWDEDVRVDTGYEEGSLVTTSYDPLIAKVVGHADTREGALTKLERALERSEVLGVRTNREFLLALLRSEAVRTGTVDTEFVERELSTLVPERARAPREAYAVAAAARAAELYRAIDPRDPWATHGGWRPGGDTQTTVVLDDIALAVHGRGPFAVGEQLVRADGDVGRWRIDDRPAVAVRGGDTMWAVWRGTTFELSLTSRERSVETTAGAEVVAPMPGVVVGVSATAGRQARRGDLLFVVEAMKMELRVEAPADGVVTKVLAREGQQVGRGERLADFEADPS
jgi:3-methylcrotonyl-CoA carboxylase alpha subunit